MNNPVIAAEKLKMMKGSVHCLIDGFLGFIPFIGLGFALAALWISGRVRRQEKFYWNPAKPYRIVGMCLGAMTAILWSGILIFVFGNLLISLL